MRRILVAVAGTLSGLGLIFLYPTSTGGTVDAATTGGTTTAGGSTSGGTTSSRTTAGSGTGSGSGTTAGSGSSTGSTGTDSSTGSAASGSAGTTAGPTGTYSASTSMRYGTVTVTVTMADGRLTDASATQDSPDGHSRSISGQAIPVLNSEAVDAQSAGIALVSHATYTSQAYTQSLQAALDAAAQS